MIAPGRSGLVIVRPAAAADAAVIAAIYAPYVEGGTISFEDVAPDAAAMQARMTAGDGLFPWLVAEADDAILGYAYASAWSPRTAYRWTVETTIYLAPAATGAGTGARLYGALLATLRAQGFRQAIGRISRPNPRSEAFHARMGFACTGVQSGIGWKQGRWIDVAVWQRALAESAEQPAEPRAFAAVDVVAGLEVAGNGA